MLRGKVEGEMALLSECSSVKVSPEDKQASAPCIRGSTKILVKMKEVQNLRRCKICFGGD